MLDSVGLVVAIVAAIFGYRYAAKKQQSRTLDGYAIKKLEESGLDITKEYQIEFWFCSDESDAIARLANELEERMLEVYVSETEQDPRFVIRALKTMTPELSELQHMRKDFNSLAKKYGAEYDGWGCSS